MLNKYIIIGRLFFEIDLNDLLVYNNKYNDLAKCEK